MPTQMELEYQRNSYQRMNRESFIATNTIAIITHSITQPLDMEIYLAGSGVKTISSFELSQQEHQPKQPQDFPSSHISMANQQRPRRIAKPDYMVFAGLAGGFVADVVTNPINIVFNRMQIDELFPFAARINYANLLDCQHVAKERAFASMTRIFDWCKEKFYHFLGPHWINKLWGTAIADSLGTQVSVPLDMVRTRVHTMKKLPSSLMPQYGSSSLVCYVSLFLIDFYDADHFDQEFRKLARFQYQADQYNHLRKIIVKVEI
ncbi:UNKNOWN [Stylonychia lemnae]|uniref:Mitochondrial carrier protein n=1 Tax=Stylonychia lemnae TaxID=5949 RepID=A0A078B1D2_STYLE|nr:UNKNOWN [Stylonychia lemnae]|eukprot:CDW88131.1 UNKNOWN [Stylonychia lemnae]